MHFFYPRDVLYYLFAAPLESILTLVFNPDIHFLIGGCPVIYRNHVVALLRIKVTAKKSLRCLQADFFFPGCFSLTHPPTCLSNAIWDSAPHAPDY